MHLHLHLARRRGQPRLSGRVEVSSYSPPTRKARTAGVCLSRFSHIARCSSGLKSYRDSCPFALPASAPVEADAVSSAEAAHVFHADIDAELSQVYYRSMPAWPARIGSTIRPGAVILFRTGSICMRHGTCRIAQKQQRRAGI
jgi:hypothetical protein